MLRSKLPFYTKYSKNIRYVISMETQYNIDISYTTSKYRRSKRFFNMIIFSEGCI